MKAPPMKAPRDVRVAVWAAQFALSIDKRMEPETAASHADEAVELLDGLDANDSPILKVWLAERAKR